MSCNTDAMLTAAAAAMNKIREDHPEVCLMCSTTMFTVIAAQSLTIACENEEMPQEEAIAHVMNSAMAGIHDACDVIFAENKH